MASKRITQETFDAAVRENIQEFEMGPEEAVREAVEQFESQGRAVRLGLSAGLALRLSHLQSTALFAVVVATPLGTWDPGSLTRDQTHAPCVYSMEP